MKTLTLYIEQMDCPTEEQLIRNRLGTIKEIEELQFNLMDRRLTVRHTLTNDDSIVTAIEALGMKARRNTDGAAIDIPVVQPSFWRKRGTILTLLSGVCAILAETLVFSGMDEQTPAIRILAVAAILAGGYEVAGKAWIALRNFTLNINFLMSVAVIGALIIGEWTEAAVVIFLFSVAELIESRSLEQARQSVRLLMELAPDTATVQRRQLWLEVPSTDVKKGEFIRIKPGERLPLDGIVRQGSSQVNQSPVTGESMPVSKQEGSTVFAGSINGSGTFDYEVTHTTSESTISQVVRLIEQAMNNRAGAERFVDKFARYYTPVVFVLAIITAVLPPLLWSEPFNEWLYRGLVLLVIGCPCALVISTPVTIVSGLSAAARRGILIKGGTYLELGKTLRAVAFDKTGTLTEGQPRVTDIVVLDGSDKEQIQHLAAAIEAKSEHPIASAIIAEHLLQHPGEEEIPVENFHSITGKGVYADVQGERIYVGNHRLAHELEVCNEETEIQLTALESEGKTVVIVMTGSQILGIIAVADTLRTSSLDAVGELQRMNLHTVMLTGDNETTARSIAASAGIDEVYANLLPADKTTIIRNLQHQYGTVGMVGDGINDAPALAQANVGFAMGAAGTDIALEAADVALMEDNLQKLPEYIRLSRHSMAVLWQNIWLALGIKFVFFVLTLLGEATLWMAIFADMGASLIVIFNGLRLLRHNDKS
jgi:Cd2+/Zn2+-exporting ATPase